MIYVLYGLEDYLINKEIKKIIKDNNIDEISMEKYDLTDTPLDKVIDAALSTSLFSDKKMIVASNASFLSSTNKNSNINHNLDAFDKYINNPNESTIFVLIVNTDKLDDRKKIVKTLKEKATIKEFNTEKNLYNIVASFFEGYKIDSKGINKFIDRVGNNLLNLENEAYKLTLYKEDEKVILDEDIEKVIHKNVDTDIFTLIDNIVLKNKVKAIESYNEMLKCGEEPIKILIMLASQFRLMLQCKLLYKRGYMEKDIASTLKIHPYRVKLALLKGKKFTENDLLSYLSNLADLDSKIKQSEIDKKLFLEMFILNL